jgi:hypothetical protein
MRQIYTSQREENIDRVVAMMKEAGIDTSVTNRSNYRRDYKGPSYTTKVARDTWPQVWVVRSEDQTRARALLREAGVEAPTRFAEELAQSRSQERTPEQRRAAFMWRMRTLVLAGIAFLLVCNYLGIIQLF